MRHETICVARSCMRAICLQESDELFCESLETGYSKISGISFDPLNLIWSCKNTPCSHTSIHAATICQCSFALGITPSLIQGFKYIHVGWSEVSHSVICFWLLSITDFRRYAIQRLWENESITNWSMENWTLLFTTRVAATVRHFTSLCAAMCVVCRLNSMGK